MSPMSQLSSGAAHASWSRLELLIQVMRLSATISLVL
jgi:hypothetical protein